MCNLLFCGIHYKLLTTDTINTFTIFAATILLVLQQVILQTTQYVVLHLALTLNCYFSLVFFNCSLTLFEQTLYSKQFYYFIWDYGVYMTVYMSIYLYNCLSVHPSVCLVALNKKAFLCYTPKNSAFSYYLNKQTNSVFFQSYHGFEGVQKCIGKKGDEWNS